MVDISRQIKNILLNSQMAALVSFIVYLFSGQNTRLLSDPSQTTNFTVRGGDEKDKFKPNQLKPALGEAWSHMANTQLFLHNHNLESDNLNTISDESTNYFWGELLASSHNVSYNLLWSTSRTNAVLNLGHRQQVLLQSEYWGYSRNSPSCKYDARWRHLIVTDRQ